MKIIRQLSVKDIAGHRKSLAAKQKYICPICKGSIAHGISVLDHNHKDGMIRGSLCKSCNEGEGRVLAGMEIRTPLNNLAYRDRVAWLRNLADYWEHHDNNKSGFIHPTFDLVKGRQKPIPKPKTNKKLNRKTRI